MYTTDNHDKKMKRFFEESLTHFERNGNYKFVDCTMQFFNTNLVRIQLFKLIDKDNNETYRHTSISVFIDDFVSTLLILNSNYTQSFTLNSELNTKKGA